MMSNPLQQLIRGVVLVGLVLASASPALAREKVEDRLTRIEKLLSSGALTDLANQQEQLRYSIQMLQGEVELLRRDVNDIKAHQRDLFADIDRRLSQLEAGASAGPSGLPPIGDDLESDPAAQPEVGQQQDLAAQADGELPVNFSGNEAEDYQMAFSLLKAGRYADASQAFEAFLQRYPRGAYTANALYWLGESHYVVRDFAKATPYFQRVLEEHADSAKHPDAMLKIGFVHFELGELDKARAILERVVASYPNSSAAALAEQRLLRMSR